MSSKAHAAFKRLDSGAAEAVGFAGHYRFFSTRDNYGGLQGSKLCDVKHIRSSSRQFDRLFAPFRYLSSTIRSTIGQLVFTFVV